MSLDTQVKDKCKHVQMTPIGPCDCKRVVPLMFRSLHYPEGWRSMPLDQWLRSVDNGGASGGDLERHLGWFVVSSEPFLSFLCLDLGQLLKQ